MCSHINVGSGKDLAIKELAEIIGAEILLLFETHAIARVLGETLYLVASKDKLLAVLCIHSKL